MGINDLAPFLMGPGGTRQEPIISLAQSYGFQAGFYTPNSFADMNAWTAAGNSFILLWRTSPTTNHYSVFNSADQHSINVMDPTRGNVIYDISHFRQLWAAPAIWIR